MIERLMMLAVIASLVLASGDARARLLGGAAEPGKWISLEADGFPEVFAWTDTCNVYALRDGDAAVRIDLGDGSVLDHLDEIGVKRVEWVLFTHHHREQCQGYPRLAGSGAKVAGPQAERALFENPASFRKMRPSPNDAFTVHGASYVRPRSGRSRSTARSPGWTNSPGAITTSAAWRRRGTARAACPTSCRCGASGSRSRAT
jgi:hypothetical protein